MPLRRRTARSLMGLLAPNGVTGRRVTGANEQAKAICFMTRAARVTTLRIAGAMTANVELTGAAPSNAKPE